MGLNEWEVQCKRPELCLFNTRVSRSSISVRTGVGEAEWAFKTTFDVSKDELSGHKHFDLVFDGLDTFATVKLVCAPFLSDHVIKLITEAPG